MATLLFIDTNIWLDFYRSNNEAGLSLLRHLQKLSEFIIATDQVEMEFKKNRQGVLLQSAKNLTPPQSILIPAFLSNDDADGLASPLEKAQRLVKTIKSHLPKILEDPEVHDPVYQICHEVFSKQDSLRYGQGHENWKEVQDAALMRHQLGYPPRKPDDTSMGDAVNWEWIVYCAKKSKSNIAIVSRDSDYGQFYGEKGYLNDHLKREFSDRVGKERKISLYRMLTPVLKDFKVIVTKKEQQEENRIIQSSEGASFNIRPFPNNRSALYGTYYESANSPLALWSSVALEAATHIAQQQAAIDAAENKSRDEEKDPS